MKLSSALGSGSWSGSHEALGQELLGGVQDMVLSKYTTYTSKCSKPNCLARRFNSSRSSRTRL